MRLFTSGDRIFLGGYSGWFLTYVNEGNSVWVFLDDIKTQVSTQECLLRKDDSVAINKVTVLNIDGSTNSFSYNPNVEGELRKSLSIAEAEIRSLNREVSELRQALVSIRQAAEGAIHGC